MENCYPLPSYALLCPRRNGARSQAAKHRNELAPSHGAAP